MHMICNHKIGLMDGMTLQFMMVCKAGTMPMDRLLKQISNSITAIMIQPSKQHLSMAVLPHSGAVAAAGSSHLPKIASHQGYTLLPAWVLS